MNALAIPPRLRLIDQAGTRARLFEAIAAVPAGVKLSIPALRDALVSQADVLAGLQSLIAEGLLDPATLRPVAPASVEPPPPRPPTGAELADRLAEHCTMHGLSLGRAMRHLRVASCAAADVPLARADELLAAIAGPAVRRVLEMRIEQIVKHGHSAENDETLPLLWLPKQARRDHAQIACDRIGVTGKDRNLEAAEKSLARTAALCLAALDRIRRARERGKCDGRASAVGRAIVVHAADRAADRDSRPGQRAKIRPDEDAAALVSPLHSLFGDGPEDPADALRVRRGKLHRAELRWTTVRHDWRQQMTRSSASICAARRPASPFPDALPACRRDLRLQASRR
jgi:hypothetical protein